MLFSFDAETNGLWGQAFAIAAIVYDTGTEISRFVGRCPIEDEVDSWVAENVIPKIVGIEENFGSYKELLQAFSRFYCKNRENNLILVHMGVPVESRIIADMHKFGFIEDWDGPYPLIDLSGILLAKGEDPTSVDKFLAKVGITVGNFEGGTHNPLYDSAAAAAAYFKLMD